MSRTQIHLEDLPHAAAEACDLLKVLANRDRLLLLCRLSEGEYCVGELEESTGIRQPTLSQQLTILRENDMVSARRDGKQMFYSIASTQALAVMAVLHELYCKGGKARKGSKK